MISCYIEGEYNQGNHWTIQIPHEINNKFLWEVHKAIVNKQVDCEDFDIRYSDFGKVVIENDNLQKLINDYDILNKNLEKIIQIVPLPKTIGNFDGFYHKGFVVKGEDENIVYSEKDFNTNDMKLIIDLIVKKAKQAKLENKKLIFIGD